MAIKELDGADQMRLEQKVALALTEAITQFQPWFGKCRHGVLSWRVQEGTVDVEFKPTFKVVRQRH